MSILSIVHAYAIKRSKFLKSSPPYADTVIGPNSQQWVGSQDEWLSHTLKEPIFDVIKVLWCTENLKPLASQLAVCTCSFSKREAQFTFRIGRFIKFVIKLVQRKANYWKGMKKRPIISNVTNATHYCILTHNVAYFSRNYNEQLGSVENVE
ncbi:hypothetical protein T07_4649 [Trichinella nelsoni]|uniref:Uncharacterized protein n=1 Tax=Trichinella nelsoni TaxID=6336 RepID=A0A0V0SLS5_9BILA|nr:hypothetical protein T07_4649 [Trichinella nelsoni]